MPCMTYVRMRIFGYKVTTKFRTQEMNIKIIAKWSYFAYEWFSMGDEQQIASRAKLANMQS